MFYDNIYKICHDKGTSPTAVVRELGYSSGNVSKWKQGSIPNVEMCLAIAQKLDVTLDYLVTLKEPKPQGLSDSDKEWLDLIARIPEDKKAMCKAFLETHVAVQETPAKYADKKRA